VVEQINREIVKVRDPIQRIPLPIRSSSLISRNPKQKHFNIIQRIVGWRRYHYKGYVLKWMAPYWKGDILYLEKEY
jgi:hypothetical protein